MFYVLISTDEKGITNLYLCRASDIDKACAMTGLLKDDVSHCIISKDMLDHVSNIEAGYIRMEL